MGFDLLCPPQCAVKMPSKLVIFQQGTSLHLTSLKSASRMGFDLRMGFALLNPYYLRKLFACCIISSDAVIALEFNS